MLFSYFFEFFPLPRLPAILQLYYSVKMLGYMWPPRCKPTPGAGALGFDSCRLHHASPRLRLANRPLTREYSSFVFEVTKIIGESCASKLQRSRAKTPRPRVAGQKKKYTPKHGKVVQYAKLALRLVRLSSIERRWKAEKNEAGPHSAVRSPEAIKILSLGTIKSPGEISLVLFYLVNTRKQIN